MPIHCKSRKTSSTKMRRQKAGLMPTRNQSLKITSTRIRQHGARQTMKGNSCSLKQSPRSSLRTHKPNTDGTSTIDRKGTRMTVSSLMKVRISLESPSPESLRSPTTSLSMRSMTLPSPTLTTQTRPQARVGSLTSPLSRSSKTISSPCPATRKKGALNEKRKQSFTATSQSPVLTR